MVKLLEVERRFLGVVRIVMRWESEIRWEGEALGGRGEYGVGLTKGTLLDRQSRRCSLRGGC